MKFYRNLSIVCLILGLAMIIGGAINGGAKEASFLKNFKWARNVAVFTDFADGSEINFSQEYELNSDAKLVLDVSAMDVNIIRTEDTKIKIEAFEISDNSKIEFNNNKLEIKMGPPHKFFSTSGAELNIYIPQNYNFSKVEMDVAASDVDVEELNADKIDINCDAGDINFNRLNSKEIDLEANASDVSLGLTGNVDDYDVDKDATLSDINIPRQSGHNYHYSRSLDIEVNVGDVDVTFLGE